ncbi:Gfo/Idh/MocA family protein [Alkalitalea saponilacus]|uniref:Uncharacterized protein n=1 Tax=Alkalitalea saponilacus TaxID=889453 RepID=A0A1T5H0V9_9BACT|nr:Gfo/Idh/MocA family oxidoreductase [Alkalitalea saponilacus]ASB50951.1 NDP-hexose-3-ketoreductase [Alkalitalea saponilacus]SKC14160.1 hypothetical protein SAMN03080601_02011 [Alkalitalea saponilacus]
MENNSIVKIGILGCANIAQRSIIPEIIKLNKLFELIGIASRDITKATNCADKFNTKPFLDYQSLIDDPEIQAVYIPLPNSLHAEWINKALDKGLHVLVEKSLACNYNEVNQLNKKAEEKKLTLMENFQFRFHSQLAEIKKMVDDGVIEELRTIRSSFGFPPFPDDDNIRYNKNLGGGALLDAGAYPLKISRIFMGSDIEVASASLKYDPEKEVDIWGGATIKQINGDLFSQVAFGFDHYYQCNLELWGSKGKISTNRIFTAPPGYEPTILLETSQGTKEIKLPADNHFEKMLIHFQKTILHPEIAIKEYSQNNLQAKLIEQLKNKANE